jgi:hypothetical protein
MHTDSSGVPTGPTYPNSRSISYDYGTASEMNDVLSRIQNLKDGATTLAGYTYLGSGTVVRLDYTQPQVRLDLWGGGSGYAGMDDFGRIKDQRWVNYNTSTDLDRFQYAYDRNSSRISRDNTLTAGLDELYAYDSLDRLTAMDRGTISGGSIASPVKEQDWTLDPTGNWSDDKRTPTPFPTVIRREHPQPQIRLDLWGGTSRAYAGLDGFQYAFDGVRGSWPGSAPARFHGSGHGTLRLSWPAERSVTCPTAWRKQAGSATAVGMMDVTFASSRAGA